MNNITFLKAAVVILIVINCITIGFMWSHKPPHMPPPHQGPEMMAQYLSQELHFTDDQKQQFAALRRSHAARIEDLRSSSRMLHDKYFDLLGANADSATVHQYADSLVAIQKQIELLTYFHFSDVRSICTPKQQRLFDSIISEALHMMAPRPR
jgi:periplasmic protein CpxP/Spy